MLKKKYMSPLSKTCDMYTVEYCEAIKNNELDIYEKMPNVS